MKSVIIVSFRERIRILEDAYITYYKKNSFPVEKMQSDMPYLCLNFFHLLLGLESMFLNTAHKPLHRPAPATSAASVLTRPFLNLHTSHTLTVFTLMVSLTATLVQLQLPSTAYPPSFSFCLTKF